MKAKIVMKSAFVASFGLALLLFGCMCNNDTERDSANDSNGVLKSVKEKRRKELFRLERKTYKRAREKLSRGQYTEAIGIAKKGIKKLRDNDYDDFPKLVGTFYFNLATVAELARLELYEEANLALEKSMELAKKDRDSISFLRNISFSQANLYHSIGAHKEAEAKLLDAIAPANSVSTMEDHVSGTDVYRRKYLMWFYSEHGKKEEARELANTLGMQLEKMAEQMKKEELGYPFYSEDELKALLEEK